MSGSFVSPHALTSGAGYKANPTYDEFLRKHSGFYRRHSAASAALDEDRRRSSAGFDGEDGASGGGGGGMASHAAQALSNHHANSNLNPTGEHAEQPEGTGPRRGSLFTRGDAGAATANTRKGSVVVGSSADRKDSIFGLEASRGHVDLVHNGGDGAVGGQERRASQSLASELWGKMRKGSSS